MSRLPVSLVFISNHIMIVEPEGASESVGEEEAAAGAIRALAPTIKFEQQIMISQNKITFGNFNVLTVLLLVDQAEQRPFFYFLHFFSFVRES